MAPWKEDAARMGIRSSGAFPIRINGEVWDTPTLSSGQTGYFDDEVVRLVDEMALTAGIAHDWRRSS
jgi:hypothetical protein